MIRKFWMFTAILLIALCFALGAEAEKNGWVNEDDYLCYYSNGMRLNNVQTIDGIIYNFTSDGILKGNGGVQEIKGRGFFYLNSSNKVQYGWQTVAGKKYYFDLQSGRAYEGNSWGPQNIIDGKQYLFNDQGVLVINDWWTRWSYVGPFFHSNSEGIVDTGYTKINGTYYIFLDNGESASGWRTVNSQLHFFNKNHETGKGYAEARGWVHDDSKWYFCDLNDGHLLTNTTLTDHGIKYLLGEDGPLVLAENTVVYVDEIVYGIDKEGSILSGWQTIDGAKYFFGNHGAYTGSQEIDGAYYYFNEDGKMQTNLLIKTKSYMWSEMESLFYYGSDGKRVTGWQTINGSKYYFGDYGAYTGSQEIERSYYYFNDEGVMQTNILVWHKRYSWDEKERLYYYGSDGKRVTGWKTINGEKYYFDLIDGAYFGTRWINDLEYTFSDDGILLYTVVPVTGITLDKTQIQLKPGYSETLTVSITPEDATNKKVSWSSSDINIVKVDSNGTVTAVGAGYATILALTEYRNYAAYCDVVVIEVEPVEAYVTRCYSIILGRQPDEGGLNTWVNELNSGRKAAAEIIEQFVASAEFQNKNLSNADAVEILYKAMLGRGSDPSGKADWLAKLNAGQHITAVINGFCGSAEFKAICDSYGIQPGTVTVKDGTPVTPGADNEKIKAYVERCYQIILGRGADEGGLNTWMDELTSGRKAAAEIIEQFVASAEFQNKKLSNSDSVEILYKAMLGRGSDPAGKASWVEKLDEGQDLTAVINGFCGSAEFKAICDSYGIQPGTVTVKQPTTPAANDEKIQAFVARCYKIILGRDADEGGMNTWFNELKSGRKAAAEIIESFVNSQEFKNKNYSNADAVEILYKAMLGRGSDPAGKADWVEKLNAGQPLEAVINGFCGSAEFKAICDAYGITPGTVNVPQLSKMAVMEEVPAEKPVVKETVNNVTRVEITNASDTVNENLGTAVQAIYINEEKAKEFIGRCYQAILGREAGAEELNGWIGQMMNGSKTADQIARGFLFSGEFKGRNIGNEELVKILYRVYMNREADAEGLATWTQKLDEGTSLNDLLNVFAKTGEFKAVLKDMAQ